MLGRFMTTSLLPTSVKCTTAVQWWLSNSILQFSWRKLTHSIWGRAGVKNTPDRRICLVAWLNLVFQSRHLSLWTIAGRPDCQLTHSNGAFFSSQSTLYLGNISLLPFLSASFDFLAVLLFLFVPRSLFLYVETEASVGSTLPTGLSNAVKRNDDILTFVKVPTSHLFLIKIAIFALCHRRFCLLVRRSFWELWRCLVEPQLPSGWMLSTPSHLLNPLRSFYIFLFYCIF